MSDHRVTIRAVANAAGVSVSTVSNVISGRHQQMSPETLERVRTAMNALSYQPNPVARSLVTRRTATIGLVMSDVRNPLYPPVTVGAEAACRDAGYGLLLATAADPESELRAVELMYAKRVDALVVFSVSYVNPDNRRLDELQQRGFPIVPINRPLSDDSALSAVWFDHEGGAYQATQHLIELGHRKIMHVTGPADRLTAIDRRRGFERAMCDAGLPTGPDSVLEADFSFTTGERLAPALLEREPTAIFAGGDALAMGMLRGLLRLGHRVPEDISLIAFGNPEFVRYTTPAMTTIDLPVSEAGRAAVELALHRLQHPEERKVRTLTTELLVRESTAPLRIG
jgi:LacI family transcriptional regulator